MNSVAVQSSSAPPPPLPPSPRPSQNVIVGLCAWLCPYLSHQTHTTVAGLTLARWCRLVDFGPGMDVDYAFKAQATMNPEGLSPPFCTEF